MPVSAPVIRTTGAVAWIDMVFSFGRTLSEAYLHSLVFLTRCSWPLTTRRFASVVAEIGLAIATEKDFVSLGPYLKGMPWTSAIFAISSPSPRKAA